MKRKGWRKGPIREGNMRLKPCWKNSDIKMTVAGNAGSYYFYGNGMNSQAGFNCIAAMFETPLEAMVAAETAVVELFKAVEAGECPGPLTLEKIAEGEKAIREGRTISHADLKAELGVKSNDQSTL